ncbi:hypothetical protein V8G54_020721 [Vigna mungo]|uniref:Uncharacterized protein n=1 Tax=Vigna mungo TaxID=3915 RepID=A0AAQ3NE98_VIGMU
MSVSSCGLDFKDTLLNGEERNVKSTTSQIKDQDILFANTSSFLVKPVCNSCSSWLIYYSHNIEASNDSGIFGGLTLRVIEVSRHGDNSVLHICPKISLCNLPHLS